MDKITEIYLALIEQIKLIYPARKRLFDSYNLENNPLNTLKSSWGLKLTETNLLDDYICNLVYDQGFEFFLIDENLTYNRSNELQDSELISLINDTIIFLRNLVKTFNLSANIDIATSTGSSPIESLDIEKNNYLIKRITFTVRVTETI